MSEEIIVVLRIGLLSIILLALEWRGSQRAERPQPPRSSSRDANAVRKKRAP